eukprot:1132933-Prymnesium_polylepis.1
MLLAPVPPPLAPPEEPWSLGRTTSVQAQHGIPTACRVQGTSPRSRFDRFKLKTAHPLVKLRLTAAAHYSFSTPPPDDGTPTHAPRHRVCFMQTTVRYCLSLGI